MRGHLGAVLTSGLAVLALALALLQASVLLHSAQRNPQPTASSAPAPTNRWSAPGGRSAIPWLPFDKPGEGRSAPRPPEEHRAPLPPPSRQRAAPPRGPQAPRKLTA